MDRSGPGLWQPQAWLSLPCLATMGPMATAVRAERGVDYGLGKLIDIYRPQRPAGLPVVLLWHGAGHSRARVIVCVPDWRPDAPDNGRRHLLASSPSPVSAQPTRAGIRPGSCWPDGPGAAAPQRGSRSTHR